ncbi:hypothetical protein BS329_11155 [Amycolatopsis coloradensis]|uniref:Ig-like domain-containing protein n=2 Tax=Amycolatopsis coloradensis TaxID=76021 RepID=A0A1R0KWE1_9PSEU|nr:hypothetical protein BS329_11155 [Amycolatopsis coloradensis]
MMIKNAAGVMVLFAGLTFAAEGEANAARDCASGVKTIKPVVLETPKKWTYTYGLSWCADGGKVTWAEPSVTPRVHDVACRWAGRIEESVRPVPDSVTWSAYDMGEFSCRDNAGKEHGVNPWVVVTFDPAGGYDTRSGIAAA